MKPLNLKRVLNALLVSFAFTLVFTVFLVAFYALVGSSDDDASSSDAMVYVEQDRNQFLVILGLYTLVALGVVIVTNLAARLPGDIDYFRDTPAMSPACATFLNNIVDPAPEGFSTLDDVAVSSMAATLLALQERNIIAIYPGAVADYAGFDLRRPDDAGLQGRAREVAEAQRSVAAAQVAAGTAAETTNESNTELSSRRARARAHHKRPAPMAGVRGILLWNTPLGPGLRMNRNGQDSRRDVSQKSGLVSTISLLPVAFENPRTSSDLAGLSPSEQAFLEFLKDFSHWQGSTVFDLNQLRAACAAEDEALAEKKSQEEDDNRKLRVSKGLEAPVSLDGLFRGYAPQARFFRRMRDEAKKPKLVDYQMGILLFLLSAAFLAFLIGWRPFTDLWDRHNGYTAIELGALGIFIGIATLFCTQPYALTAEGKRAVIQLLGLKKYLRDFSDFKSRGADAVEVWGQYLVYATALGLSRQTCRQLSVYVYYPAAMEAYNYYNYDYEGMVTGGSSNSGGSETSGAASGKVADSPFFHMTSDLG
ncbi:DUF2207 domain-containing protein [Bifidobacterium sp. ESL0690]|uniref:DUF2207 family protein n=1 Tax=Bifidobacterium sp. ESL0690 TaxID=2983214 RepID=UPI0023F7F325|nr:DUF2207 domain-containing protein [Bifidobacterium sp. ESL0690]WEV46438.1 DUF2207 domain-containing protein [Bifidobacterium sp. ESL0690]